MQLFLDTADPSEVRQAVDWGVIQGVTTNPSLISKQRGDFHSLIREICDIVQGPVSAEVISVDTAGMLREAEELAALSPHVVIKIPMTPAGLSAVKELSRQSVKTNVTLIFSANQALLAALAGATYVSPFVGRLDDTGHEGMQLIRDIGEIFALHDFPTRLLAASIRGPLHVSEAAKAGADVATLPFSVLQAMFRHPLTDAGLEKFLADWASYRS